MFRRNALFVGFVIVLALLAITGNGLFAAEGTKIMKADKPPVVITVPEKAPDFLNWGGTIMVGERYENGNVLLIVAFESPDEQVAVTALWAKVGDKYFLLAFAVFYEVRPNAPPDMYEDLGFLKTGTPSGVLVRVDTPSPLAAFKAHLMPKMGV